MNNLSFQYPAWYLLLCVLLGLVYALSLYYRDKTFRDQAAWLNWLLGTLRFLAVTFIASLLLAPLLKSIVTDTKQPVVVIAQDQSESIEAELDEAALDGYKQNLNQLKSDLANEYEVKEYAFGDEVREGIDFQFTDKVSNFSEVLTGIYDLYSNQNLGAVILATDGIYNEGSNPIYSSAKLTAPVYTVALGDTTPRRDVLIKRVFHNRIAYLGDRFSMQIDIAAVNAAGSRATLSVSKVEGGNQRLLQQQTVEISSNDFFTTQEIIVDADKSGVERYRIRVSSIPDEISTANNVKDIYVDVLDARQKILILANAPHPDISALRQTLTKNKNYEVETAFVQNLNVDIANFDFVILHQIPSNSFPAGAVLNTLNTQKIPRLYIVGTQTNFPAINRAQDLVTIRANGRNTNEVQGRVNPGFKLFKLDDQIKNQINTFAPLTAPFGDFEVSSQAEVLLFQRIGRVDTRYPLLILGEENNVKAGILCAEGIWKWRLFDFLQHQNHDIFEALISKSVQYISLKEDKRRFRVVLPKNLFDENEAVVMDAELYNESYELINEPDVRLSITNRDNNQFSYTFNRTELAYSLSAGILPVGDYTFKAEVTTEGENLIYEGQFSVQPIQLEVYETTADHGLLRLLSEKYDGQLVYPDQIASIPNLIEAKGTVKPVLYQTSKTRSVMNLKWIFFVLLGLISLEWFLRRYFGAY